MNICEMCGNSIEGILKRCPFCGSEQQDCLQAKPKRSRQHKTVNLEHGRPLAEMAVKKLLSEIENSKQENTSSLTLIHGYGSSGKGGVIKHECHRLLRHLSIIGGIHSFIPGEKFSKKNGITKQALNSFPELLQNSNLNRGNLGITIVILKTNINS